MKKRCRHWWVAVAVAAAMATVGVHAKTHRDVAYVEDGHVRQVLDIFVPEGEGPWPVLFHVHGGGWRMGAKDNVSSRSGFVRRGTLVVSVGYRLTPEVKHPAHAEDVAAGLAWVMKHIASYGGDPKRIFVSGHSAGAHLAALMGADPSWLKRHQRDAGTLAGVILLDGAGYDIPTHLAMSRGVARGMYEAAFGREVSGQRAASPALRVPEAGYKPPPFLIFHVADRVASRDQSERLAKALRQAGGAARVVAASDESHASINRRWGLAVDPETRLTELFFKDPEGVAQAAEHEKGTPTATDRSPPP